MKTYAMNKKPKYSAAGKEINKINNPQDALSNIDIDTIIENMNGLKKYYIGAITQKEFKSMNIPQSEKWFVIVLIGNSNLIGHWVTIVMDNENKRIKYYDSFGDKYTPQMKNIMVPKKLYQDDKYLLKYITLIIIS